MNGSERCGEAAVERNGTAEFRVNPGSGRTLVGSWPNTSFGSTRDHPRELARNRIIGGFLRGHVADTLHR